MNPDETAAFYDDPGNAQHVCDLLERTYPGWHVWREDRVWKAQQGDVVLKAKTAGLLNQALAQMTSQEGQA